MAEKLLQTAFIKQYCINSEISEKQLLEMGLFAIPCDCGEDNCEGWQMATMDSLRLKLDFMEWTDK